MPFLGFFGVHNKWVFESREIARTLELLRGRLTFVIRCVVYKEILAWKNQLPVSSHTGYGAYSAFLLVRS